MSKIVSFIIGVVLVFPIVLLAGSVSLVGYFSQNVLQNWLYLVITGCVSITLLLLINHATNVKSHASMHKSKTIKVRQLLSSILWALFIVLITLFLTNIPGIKQHTLDTLNSPTAKLLTSSLRWPMIFSLCILSPICEEIAFRGIIQTFLTKIISYWPSVILTSIIFVFLHDTPIIQSICTFSFSVGLSVMNQRSGSLKTSIISHSAYNTIVTLMTLINL